MKGKRILIVEDDRSMCDLLARDLGRRGFTAECHLAAAPAFSRLMEEDFDVLLTDLNLPGMNGIELCQKVTANRPDVPVIVITAFGSLDTAVGAIRAGAYDFVTKPVDLDMLAISLERAAKHRELQEKVKVLNKAIEQSRGFKEIVGESPPMAKLFEQISRISGTEVSVLITGESGTGKELVAHSLHRGSPRKKGPFIAINCSALPESLLESELFGFKKGAFTDAREDRTGLFVQAHGGTLFLDEVGEIPLVLQPKLLRALDDRRVRPLGSDRDVEFDVRVLAATNRDLEAAIEKGQFRQDLYYRLNVVQLEMPPLRSRGTDILLLARHFVGLFAPRYEKKITGISEKAAEKLLEYAWPGNVRELRNALERAVALTNHTTILVEDLPAKVRAYQPSPCLLWGDDLAGLPNLDVIERRYILHVLDCVGGNKTAAARLLGLNRRTLYRKLRDFEDSRE